MKGHRSRAHLRDTGQRGEGGGGAPRPAVSHVPLQWHGDTAGALPPPPPPPPPPRPTWPAVAGALALCLGNETWSKQFALKEEGQRFSWVLWVHTARGAPFSAPQTLRGTNICGSFFG